MIAKIYTQETNYYKTVVTSQRKQDNRDKIRSKSNKNIWNLKVNCEASILTDKITLNRSEKRRLIKIKRQKFQNKIEC